VRAVFEQAVTWVCDCAVSHTPQAVLQPAVGVLAQRDGVWTAL
jgi:hypothetical protein